MIYRSFFVNISKQKMHLILSLILMRKKQMIQMRIIKTKKKSREKKHTTNLHSFFL